MNVPRILATHRAKVTILVGEDAVFMICASVIELSYTRVTVWLTCRN